MTYGDGSKPILTLYFRESASRKTSYSSGYHPGTQVWTQRTRSEAMRFLKVPGAAHCFSLFKNWFASLAKKEGNPRLYGKLYAKWDIYMVNDMDLSGKL